MKIAVVGTLGIMGFIAAFAAFEGQTQPASPSAKPGEPEYVQVQHILIGFTGSVRGKNITRTQDEARTLAYEILEKAKKGEDFSALVVQHTDDRPPGIYGISNFGVQPTLDARPRDKYVPAFGNVGFALKVGEVGVADYDPKTSPFGFHVIKRLK